MMFKEMRRKEKQLGQELVDGILSQGEYGTLATIGENGYPHSLPLSYEYFDGKIYFHGALEGKKLDDIRNNPRVSFSVVTDTNVVPKKFSTAYKSVIVYGKANIIEGEEKKKALLRLIEKYSSSFMENGKKYVDKAASKTAVVEITIEHMTGKENKE